MEYLQSIALTQEESINNEGEITMAELEYALFKKMKGSITPGIDGFQVKLATAKSLCSRQCNWLLYNQLVEPNGAHRKEES